MVRTNLLLSVETFSIRIAESRIVSHSFDNSLIIVRNTIAGRLINIIIICINIFYLYANIPNIDLRAATRVLELMTDSLVVSDVQALLLNLVSS